MREFDEAERVPEIFAEAGGDCFFAEEGDLSERGVVLRRWRSTYRQS